jgi:hypothetical protein
MPTGAVHIFQSTLGAALTAPHGRLATRGAGCRSGLANTVRGAMLGTCLRRRTCSTDSWDFPRMSVPSSPTHFSTASSPSTRTLTSRQSSSAKSWTEESQTHAGLPATAPNGRRSELTVVG